MRHNVASRLLCSFALTAFMCTHATACRAASSGDDKSSIKQSNKAFADKRRGIRWNASVRYFKAGLYNPRALPPVLSPDFSRLAVAICDERLSPNQIVVDGKRGEKYKEIHEVKFSPDSQTLIYSVENAGQEFMVINGKEAKHFDSVRHVLFSPNSKRIAYIADALDTLLVLDGKEIGPYDSIDSDSMAFSPDSKHFAYSANADNKQSLYLDGKRIVTSDKLAVLSAHFTPDSKTLTHTFRVGREWFVKKLFQNLISRASSLFAQMRAAVRS